MKVRWEIDSTKHRLIGRDSKGVAFFYLYTEAHNVVGSIWQIDLANTGRGLGAHTTLESALQTISEYKE